MVHSVRWERYPLIAEDDDARLWLTIQANLGLSPNTIKAYGHALEDFFRFCQNHALLPSLATREHISLYVRDLSIRPNPRPGSATHVGLANATLQQRLTVVRLYYDFLIEQGYRPDQPVGRGRFSTSKRGLVPRYHRLPWIPGDEEWGTILEAARKEPLRNRVMFALAYDAALRREELCAIEIQDINPGQHLVRIRAETTKNRQERVVPYSEVTGVLYERYLQHRRQLSRMRGPLFLSESNRNAAQPLSIWTWSKVVRRIALQADVERFSTHTLRHLCLTDLARAGWDIHEIARFAGHRSTQTTLRYIHLSGRDLADRLMQSMDHIHARRIAMIAEVLR